MKIPHPKTYFPKNVIDLWLMGKEVDYPYIIKPAYSSTFQEEFGRKCFLINSSQELKRAVDKLRGKSFEVMVQEIIPGEETYEFYTYLNKQSDPLGICGWDRIRQYPPGFGTGSFCKSNWGKTGDKSHRCKIRAFLLQNTDRGRPWQSATS